MGVDPLEITILKCGTFFAYEQRWGKHLRKINPPIYDVMDLLRLQETVDPGYRGGRLL